jgi:hypothetical protein
MSDARALLPPMITPHPARWYILTDRGRFPTVQRALIRRRPERDRRSHLQEESAEGPGPRPPRARLQGWRLQEARFESCRQDAQGPASRKRYLGGRPHRLRRLPRPVQTRPERRRLSWWNLVSRPLGRQHPGGRGAAPRGRRARRAPCRQIPPAQEGKRKSRKGGSGVDPTPS